MYSDADRRVLGVLKSKKASFRSLMNKSRLNTIDELELEQMFLSE